MVSDEPHIQETKSRSGDDEEVHRGDVVLVIAKKCDPSLLFAGVVGSLREIARDSREANGEAEILEFGSDFSPEVFVR